MKKIIALFIVVTMILSFAACGGSGSSEGSAEASAQSASSTSSAVSEPTSEASAPAFKATGKKPEDVKIILSILTQANDFFVMMGDWFKEGFAAQGYTNFEVVNADFNAMKQVEQIENEITKGMDVLIVIPVDADAVTDVCRKAMDQGIIVGAYIKNPKAYTMMLSDPDYRENVAKYTVEAATEWAEEHHPGETVNVAVFGNNQSEEEVFEHETRLKFAKENPNFNIVDEDMIAESPVDARSLLENAITKNPDIQIVITSSQNQAKGYASYVTAEGSKVNADDFTIICCNIDEEIASLIKDGIIYASTCQAGESIAESIMTETVPNVVKCIKGEDYLEVIPTEYVNVTADNLSVVGY